MEDAKQSKPEPQPIPAEQAGEIAGGTGSCPATVSVGTGGVQITDSGPSPSDVLISTYEGVVDVTSHVIGRVADALK